MGSPWNCKLSRKPLITEPHPGYEAFLGNAINFELEHTIQHFVILLLSSSIPESHVAIVAKNVCVCHHKFYEFKFRWVPQSMWVLSHETLAIGDPRLAVLRNSFVHNLLCIIHVYSKTRYAEMGQVCVGCAVRKSFVFVHFSIVYKSTFDSNRVSRALFTPERGLLASTFQKDAGVLSVVLTQVITRDIFHERRQCFTFSWPYVTMVFVIVVEEHIGSSSKRITFCILILHMRINTANRRQDNILREC